LVEPVSYILKESYEEYNRCLSFQGETLNQLLRFNLQRWQTHYESTLLTCQLEQKALSRSSIDKFIVDQNRLL